jgi:hypothetical protein
MQTAEAIHTTTATQAAKLCTHKVGENPDGSPILCGKPATHAFTWSWGESGKCCGEHQFVLNQIAEQVGRTIGFTPLDAGVEPPMQTDERIQFNARVLTLEQELDVARRRGLEVYDTNTKLAEEGRLLMARNNALRQECDALKAHNAELDRRNGELLSQNAEQHDELERLRAFLPSDDHG